MRLREHRALLDALDRLYQPVSLAEFPGHLFGVLSALLPGTLHSFDAYNVAAGRMESHITPDIASLVPVAEIEALVGELIWQNPNMDELVRRPQGTFQLDEMTSRRSFRRTDFYQQIFRPLEVEHQLVGGIGWSGFTGAFTVNRGGAHSFTDREMELVLRLRPHVERAYAYVLRHDPGLRETQEHANGRLTEAMAAASELTGREAEVLRWLGAGKRNGEIAVILGISARTVEKHVERVLTKLGVETRTAAAAYIARPG